MNKELLPMAEKTQIRDSRWALLLVDETQIEVNEGVSLTVCEAVKHPGNPIIKTGVLGSVDDIASYHVSSVYHADGKFRMFYATIEKDKSGYADVKDKASYAESDDGIHWIKPNLDLVEFRGNKNNNIVPMPGLPVFFYDPHDPDPKKRYKKAVGRGDPNVGGRESLWTFAYSSDGFHWEIEKRPLHKIYRWAEWQRLYRVGKTWVINTQTIKQGIGRVVNIYYSDDLEKDLSEWKEKTVWRIPDNFCTHYQAHIGLSCWSRPGLVIGVYGIFCERHELEDMTCDLGFVLSHDGFNWQEPWSLATLIRRGPAGAWDSTFLIQPSPCFINVGDKTYIYYSGSSKGNTGMCKQIGLATFRRDGFGYLGIDIGWSYLKEKHLREGRFVTVPIRLYNKKTERVLLNVDNLNSKQWIKVELLDAKGQSIPGYTLKEADRITTNGIAVPATWNGNASLENVASDTVRLRIHMQGGQFRRESPYLYAIYFYQPKHIEQ